MSPYELDALAWQESWDRQQEAYLPDREERFTAMLDTVDAVAGRYPKILDLAGGTGSISIRALRRFPGATATLVDVDPVLLTIARATFDVRAAVIAADLRTPDWVTALPHRGFDAVLSATALHWFEPGRLAELYREVRDVLRPGGVFVNADHMPDDGLPSLTELLTDRANRRRRSRYSAGVYLSWEAWWDLVAKDPALGPLVAERQRVFAGRHTTETDAPVSWHLRALQAAGYSETGLIWRGAADAAVTAVA